MATLLPVQTERPLDRLMRERTILTLPGWNGSSPDHWQSIWERKYGCLERVEQRSWAEPHLKDWIDTISESIRRANTPVVLVAHSLACIAVAHWAREEKRLVRSVEAALLVTPADVDDFARIPAVLQAFAPIPRERLPFGSVFVGSEDDAYMGQTAGRNLARDWGSIFINAGAVGHINCASGHGPWPEGEQFLADLLERRL